MVRWVLHAPGCSICWSFANKNWVRDEREQRRAQQELPAKTSVIPHLSQAHLPAFTRKKKIIKKIAVNSIGGKYLTQKPASVPELTLGRFHVPRLSLAAGTSKAAEPTGKGKLSGAFGTWHQQCQGQVGTASKWALAGNWSSGCFF